MTWTEVQPNGDYAYTWGGLAMSLDGQVRAVVMAGAVGKLYLSTDGGANWSDACSAWFGVAMSDDGQVIICCSRYSGGNLTTDGGANWSAWGNDVCQFVDMTPDGKIIIATINRILQRSDDYGASWTVLGYDVVTDNGVAVSADGQKILVCGNNQLFLSEDGGASWTEQLTSIDTPLWYCCAMSKNGKMMIAGQHKYEAYGGLLYLYKNGAWAEIQPKDANQYDWNAVSLSDSGNVVFAGMYQLDDGSIPRTLYSSIDYGATWQAERVLYPYYLNPESTWNSITCRATVRILIGSNGKRLWLSSILLLPPVVHSFPWIGRFQLSHVTT
jgi:photosystem II stability/assembly factor-like uncharacterized protein